MGPTFMVACGIYVLLLIKKLEVAYRVVTHPWYAENVGSLGMNHNIELYFN